MMYFFDYGMFQGGLEEAKEDLARGRKKSAEERKASLQSNGLTMTKKQIDAQDYKGHNERLCQRVDDHGLLHAFNDTWLEVRTWNSDIRGITTLFGWSTYLLLGWLPARIWADLANALGMKLWLGGDLAGASSSHLWWSAVWITPMVIGFFWIFHRYFFRYELLTQRWIRLRFNRKTRKVYLLRPRYAGGLMVFDWTDTLPGLPVDMNPDAVCLYWTLLAWGAKELGQPTIMQAIARRTSFKTQGDWMAFWEYIRRYMEEGPDSVPEPKTVIGYRPSIKEAWTSVIQWYPAFQQKGFIGKISDGISLMILPLIFLMFVGNFLGQCLTWQARFPEEIESAGDAIQPICAC